MRFKANGEEIVLEILRHHRDGHNIRFKPAGALASVYCAECRKEIASGDRQLIDELFESALQMPRGQKNGGRKHRLLANV